MTVYSDGVGAWGRDTLGDTTMRKAMIEAETAAEAYEMAPWACGIYRCEGGFWAFEDSRDCAMWVDGLSDDDDAVNYVTAGPR